MIDNARSVTDPVSSQPDQEWRPETDFDQLDVMVAAGRDAPCELKKQYEFDALLQDTPRFLEALGVRSDAEGRLREFLAGVFSADSAGEAAARRRELPKTVFAENCASLFNGIEGSVLAPYLFARLGGNGPDDLCVKGRIRDFIYDPKTEIGHLAVDVVMELKNIGRLEFYHWDIDARLVLHRRQKSEADPFPGVDLLLPEPLRLRTINGKTNLDSIWERKLDLKLHARGCEVKVNKIFVRINDGDLELLPFWDPLYCSTPASCIDLLVASKEEDGLTPPTTYHDLRRFLPLRPGETRPVPLYCLGRCDHPTIVNSGN